jgi:hypothetical protein
MAQLLGPLSERCTLKNILLVTLDICCAMRLIWLKYFPFALMKLDIFHFIMRLVKGAYFKHPQYRSLHTAIKDVFFGRKGTAVSATSPAYIAESPLALGQKLLQVLKRFTELYPGLFADIGVSNFKTQIKLHNVDNNCLSLSEFDSLVVKTVDGKGVQLQGSSPVEAVWKGLNKVFSFQF